ncbi:tetratricopeptide repeat protein [Streptacidiphilus jiangxiensis]|uniref:Tetratricopeptide repeat-containing protein n=1 Tax=Streptacidiphilus jiangxiensis TaxID=235985 RepID=A0A1H7HVE6_STRJI|nr:tetratricopeptide repeat protein [Streptacidiphilus jiangxiensis]SEK52195.1 Tetratricopeptide repeat-containing protein [Streptacidiphilus jiangxiensis]
MTTPDNADLRLEQAQLAYERAAFGGDSSALPDAERGLDAVEADVALARGRLLHARFLDERADNARELELFERAAELYRELGDVRGEGEALFWVGAVHHITRGDAQTARPYYEDALRLATGAADRLTVSYVLRHLGFADHMAGRPEQARAQLEESTRLRRELGFAPGVAANLVGLAYLAAQQDRREDAADLLREAAELAGSSAAHGVLRQVAEARKELDLD